MKHFLAHALRRVIFPLLLLMAMLLAVAACEQDDDVCHHLRMDKQVFDPTCTDAGYTVNRCRDCELSYQSDFTAPTGHELKQKSTPPTCIEQGYNSYECQCGYSYTADYIAPMGHTMTVTVTAPTCSKQGYTDYVCTNGCGYGYTSDHVEPLGHDFKEATFAATCTTGSYSLFLCSRCDVTYRSAPSAPLGHTFTSTVVRPSIARTGYTTHTCQCGYSYVDSYVWYSDVFTGNRDIQEKPVATGIDISYWQNDVDWDALKATGIDYVILRAAYYPYRSSSPKADPRFEEYYAEARRVGLDVGCYIYSMASDVETAREEAAYMAELLRGKKFEYPIYFDFEDPSLEGVETETLMEMCLAFCQDMTDAGYFPGVYTNNRWLINYWNEEQLTTLYDLWYARYPLDDYGLTLFPYGTWNYYPWYVGQYAMWQYTEYGTIDGIEDRVDLNLCYKDYPSLIKKYGYNGFAAGS